MWALVVGPIIKITFFADSLSSSRLKHYFPSDYQSNFLGKIKQEKSKKIKNRKRR